MFAEQELRATQYRCVECIRWVHQRCSGISGKLESNVDFHGRRCLKGENGLFQSVLLKEVVVESKCEVGMCSQVLLFG